MKFAGPSGLGRAASWLAGLLAPPYKARRYLAQLNPRGYVSHSARIHAATLQLGRHVFIGDRVIIYQTPDGGPIAIGDGASIHQDVIIEVGQGGRLSIGPKTHIQPRCQFSAYKGSIQIGQGVQIAPSCAFYPYDHGIAEGQPIQQQPLVSKGGIVIEDDAWLGVGAIVLDGVTVGKGAVIGAGAVVTKDVPAGGVAVGNPARVIRMRAGNESD